MIMIFIRSCFPAFGFIFWRSLFADRERTRQKDMLCQFGLNGLVSPQSGLELPTSQMP